MTTSDEHTRTAEELEHELQELKLVKEMREKVDPSDEERGWYETRELFFPPNLPHRIELPFRPVLAIILTFRLHLWHILRYSGPASQSLSPHSLMATTLRSSGLIAIPPLAFVKNDESEALLIYHLGQDLCGHEGIVHGGVIATILDDSLARNVSLRLGRFFIESR